jgi:glutamate-ammonia-ligase adenylyltransferase
MARLLVASRLIAPDAAIPGEVARMALARACDLSDWQAVTQALLQARRDTAAAWAQIFGETLEITSDD